MSTSHPLRLRLLLLLGLGLAAVGAGAGVGAGAAREARGRSRLQDGDDALGSPGELAWQAWLLMDGTAGGAGEAGGARRITPKSVFIAPAFAPQALPPCADGHKRDAAGRCVQVVHINRDAQLSFLLQRLNALHARPAPGRLPLPLPMPLPARVQDAGPFKVPLRVPLPTPSTTSTTTTTSSTAPAEQSPATEPSPATEEPPRVSVVMADMSKRSSGEQSAEGASEPGKPLITVWTVENDTLHKTQDVEAEGTTLSVELPATTTNTTTTTTTTEAAEEAPKAAEVSPPLADVPEDALPMLVISPGTPAPDNATTPVPVPPAPAAPPSNGTAAQGEGSGDPSEDGAAGGGGGDDGDGDNDDAQTEDAPGDANDPPPQHESEGEEEEEEEEEDYDGGETGSADVMEQIEVVPISEHSRHNLPILGEDHDQDTSFSQAGGAASGFSGMFRPIPLEVMRSSQTRDDVPPQSHPVRFPSESGEPDEPHTVHFFKGNYIKFPTEHAYRYKHRPVTEEFSDAKQTFWWLPSGWRIEQQRHQQPASQDFWPRMSFSEDPSLFSQYNPSYHSPLPYQQRQAQYDPQWSSMRRQMTS